jgi:hypothetical protein
MPISDVCLTLVVELMRNEPSATVKSRFINVYVIVQRFLKY